MLMLFTLILYTIGKWVKKENVSKICLAIVDCSPAFLTLMMPYMISDNSMIMLSLFIIFILLADSLMKRANTVIGASCYIIIYFITGIYFDIFNNLKTLQFTIPATMLLIGIVILSFIKLNSWVKLGGAIYGVFALLPLMYCFGATLNVGFLSLVIGDVLLGVQYLMQIKGKKIKLINYISNMFFYTGVFLSSISFS